MTGTQKAILPGIALSITLLILLSRLVNPVITASAATQDPANSEVTPRVVNNSVCAYQAHYPAKVSQWCSLIEKAATKYGIDPLLIASVMLQESGGQPDVLSTSGAVGLMQVMPRDGISASFQCVNGPCFATRPTIEELKNPEFNIDFGVKMLVGLINRTGDVREALKSYGPFDVGYRYADQVLAIRNGL